MTRASKLILFCSAVLVIGGLAIVSVRSQRLEIPEKPLPGSKATAYPDSLFVGEARKFVRRLLDLDKPERFAMGVASAKLAAEQKIRISGESRELVLTSLTTATISRPEPNEALVSFDKRDGTYCEVYLTTIPRYADNEWGIVVTDFVGCGE